MTGGIVGSLPSGAPIRPRVKCRIPCGNSSRSEGLQLSTTEDATVQEREEGIRNKGKKQCENDIWKDGRGPAQILSRSRKHFRRETMTPSGSKESRSLWLQVQHAIPILGTLLGDTRFWQSSPAHGYSGATHRNPGVAR